ncbi:MAG TPA: DUF1559 domain-containing protein [Pirellulales bacterium]
MSKKPPYHNSAPTVIRRGLSVTELLVTISVIGLLVALTLPAIQTARESARRTQCGNHVREIGHAMLQFEQVKRRLPTGGKGIDLTVVPPAVAFDVQSTFTQLAAHFDESYLAAAVKPEYAYNDAACVENQVAARTHVSVLLCPSGAPRLADPDGYGQTDYMPIVYTDIDPLTGVRNPQALATGALALAGLPVSKIGDGLSRTIAMLEDSGRTWEAYFPNMKSGFADPLFSGGSARVFNGAAQVTYSEWLQAHQLRSQGLPAGDRQTPSGNRAMNRWAEPACGGGISGQMNSVPGKIMPLINGNSLPAGGPADCPWSTTNCGPNDEAWSAHPAGAMALMCDGSGRFVGQNIDAIILRRMVTPDEQFPYDDAAVP